MRKWFTAQELAGLPGLPGTVQGVSLRAKREGWEAQLRLGRGGGQEYSIAVLPRETQAALLKRLVNRDEPQAQQSDPSALITLDALEPMKAYIKGA